MRGGFLPALGCRKTRRWASRGGIWDERLAKGSRSHGHRAGGKELLAVPAAACHLQPTAFFQYVFKFAQSQRGPEDLGGTGMTGQKVAPTIGALRPAQRADSGRKIRISTSLFPGSYQKSVGSTWALHGRRETVRRWGSILRGKSHVGLGMRMGQRAERWRSGHGGRSLCQHGLSRASGLWKGILRVSTPGKAVQVNRSGIRKHPQSGNRKEKDVSALGQDSKGNLRGISHPPSGNPARKQIWESEAAAFLALVGDEKQKAAPEASPSSGHERWQGLCSPGRSPGGSHVSLHGVHPTERPVSSFPRAAAGLGAARGLRDAVNPLPNCQRCRHKPTCSGQHVPGLVCKAPIGLAGAHGRIKPKGSAFGTQRRPKEAPPAPRRCLKKSDKWEL